MLVLIGVTKQHAMYAQYMNASALNCQRWEGEEAVGQHKKERTGEQYRRIFIDFLRRFPGITRRKINEFMMEEIRGDLTEKQKRSKISNLMTGLRRNGRIVNKGSDKEPRWFYID